MKVKCISSMPVELTKDKSYVAIEAGIFCPTCGKRIELFCENCRDKGEACFVIENDKGVLKSYPCYYFVIDDKPENLYSITIPLGDYEVTFNLKRGKEYYVERKTSDSVWIANLKNKEEAIEFFAQSIALEIKTFLQFLMKK